MYPNPIGASGTLRIKLAEVAEDAKLEVGIYDLSGRQLLVRSYRPTPGQALNLTLEAKRLVAGIYTVRIVEADHLSTTSLLTVVD